MEIPSEIGLIVLIRSVPLDKAPFRLNKLLCLGLKFANEK